MPLYCSLAGHHTVFQQHTRSCRHAEHFRRWHAWLNTMHGSPPCTAQQHAQQTRPAVAERPTRPAVVSSVCASPTGSSETADCMVHGSCVTHSPHTICPAHAAAACSMPEQPRQPNDTHTHKRPVAQAALLLRHNPHCCGWQPMSPGASLTKVRGTALNEVDSILVATRTGAHGQGLDERCCSTVAAAGRGEGASQPWRRHPGHDGTRVLAIRVDKHAPSSLDAEPPCMPRGAVTADNRNTPAIARQRLKARIATKRLFHSILHSRTCTRAGHRRPKGVVPHGPQLHAIPLPSGMPSPFPAVCHQGLQGYAKAP